MLRGNYPAKIDEKGRLKLPASFRAYVQEKYGTALYVTSITGQFVDIYPMPIWLAREQKLLALPSTLPARQKYLTRAAYYGQATEFDVQGRVMIPWQLRSDAAMTGDVDVIGKLDMLEVWNHDRLQRQLAASPWTDDDFNALAALDF